MLQLKSEFNADTNVNPPLHVCSAARGEMLGGDFKRAVLDVRKARDVHRVAALDRQPATDKTSVTLV